MRFDGRQPLARSRRSSRRQSAPSSTSSLPAPSRFEQAERASRNYPGFDAHDYPTCFVCGPARTDGLGIFAGAVDGRGVFAAPWLVPDDVSRVLVWAALDCPGAIGVGWDGRGDWLLGRMTAEVLAVPTAGDRCVVVVVAARPRREEGLRRHRALPWRRPARAGAPDLDRARVAVSASGAAGSRSGRRRGSRRCGSRARPAASCSAWR